MILSLSLNEMTHIKSIIWVLSTEHDCVQKNYGKLGQIIFPFQFHNTEIQNSRIDNIFFPHWIFVKGCHTLIFIRLIILLQLLNYNIF